MEFILDRNNITVVEKRLALVEAVLRDSDTILNLAAAYRSGKDGKDMYVMHNPIGTTAEILAVNTEVFHDLMRERYGSEGFNAGPAAFTEGIPFEAFMERIINGQTPETTQREWVYTRDNGTAMTVGSTLWFYGNGKPVPAVWSLGKDRNDFYMKTNPNIAEEIARRVN